MGAGFIVVLIFLILAIGALAAILPLFILTIRRLKETERAAELVKNKAEELYNKLQDAVKLIPQKPGKTKASDKPVIVIEVEDNPKHLLKTLDEYDKKNLTAERISSLQATDRSGNEAKRKNVYDTLEKNEPGKVEIANKEPEPAAPAKKITVLELDDSPVNLLDTLAEYDKKGMTAERKAVVVAAKKSAKTATTKKPATPAVPGKTIEAKIVKKEEVKDPDKLLKNLNSIDKPAKPTTTASKPVIKLE